MPPSGRGLLCCECLWKHAFGEASRRSPHGPYQRHSAGRCRLGVLDLWLRSSTANSSHSPVHYPLQAPGPSASTKSTAVLAWRSTSTQAWCPYAAAPSKAVLPRGVRQLHGGDEQAVQTVQVRLGWVYGGVCSLSLQRRGLSSGEKCKGVLTAQARKSIQKGAPLSHSLHFNRRLVLE